MEKSETSVCLSLICFQWAWPIAGLQLSLCLYVLDDPVYPYEHAIQRLHYLSETLELLDLIAERGLQRQRLNLVTQKEAVPSDSHS